MNLHFEAIDALGGLSRQLLGDMHFKSPHCDEVAERFGAPLYCSELEAPDVLRSVKQVMTFPFTRHLLENGVEVLPTPGHRDGGVCYLIRLGERRYLFVGDFIWHDGARWIPTARKATVLAYRQSLAALEALEFDMLLANSILSNTICAVTLNTDNRHDFFNDLRAQLTDV